jgi:choline-glycine betaine transporter
LSDTEEEVGLTLALTIWIVTVLSTASVISGLRGGVRFFSCIAFGLSVVLLCLILAMDDTKFLLNLQVQEVGTIYKRASSS